MLKHLLIFLALYLSTSIPSFSQTSNPYSAWVEENYPVTYTNIGEMIRKVYGDGNEDKFKFLVEFQAKSLYNLFELLNKEDADWELFSTALTQWTQSKPEGRSENWWEWPDTNWNKVESEYLFLLDTK